MKASDRYVINGAACLVDGQRLSVANVSVGGLFAVTDRPFIPGQPVSFELALPEQEPLHVSGHITWVQPPEELAPRPPGVGIRITQISLVDKITLLSVLRRSDLQGRRIRGSDQ